MSPGDSAALDHARRIVERSGYQVEGSAGLVYERKRAHWGQPIGPKSRDIMPYYQLYYHIVWATKNREPLITPELEPELHNYLRGKGMEFGGVVHAVGGVEEHVHLAVSIPPRIAVATYIGQLKGASSHWVTHVSPVRVPFEWQEGYGALSFGKRALPRVVDYVLNQHQRHADRRLIPEMERMEGDN